ncbi:MAG: T9SS C-terminal target domain-containing protein [Chitinophagia bacterium]|nr:T9SS C-terminal target domain-containing protein [Chitinophagia bacterium]
MFNVKSLTAIIALSLLSICTHAQTYDTLCKFGSYWKYLDDGSSQDATGWKLSSFSDGTWGCGASPIGYGDTWIVTCIRSGCTAQTNCYLPSTCSVNATDYFRRKINIPNVSIYDTVLIDGLVDDGLILYVNGNLEWNYGMPTTFTYTTWSTNSSTGGPETTLVSKFIPITHFANGDNQIAVELHQRAANTSDACLDLRMAFRKKTTSGGINNMLTGKDLSFYPNPSTGKFTIKDNSNALSGTPYKATILDLSGKAVTTVEGSFNGAATEITLDLPAGTYIARLIGEKVNASFTITIDKK